MRKLLLSLAAAALFTGCASTAPNPNYTSVTPQGVIVTNAAQPQFVYSANTNLPAYQAEFSSFMPVVQAVLSGTPLAPAAPFLPSLANLIFGALALVSGGLAAYKNRQAQSHADAAAALAAVVAPQPGLVANVMTIAAGNDSTKAVAQHLANAVSLT